ncbi:MAG: Rne/Rng family ribonuclease [Lentisphaerae bacterium]|nr:Rne/Rng family ribonuclease [Lentisphaerota bacterium]
MTTYFERFKGILGLGRRKNRGQKEIVISVESLETRVAILENGRLEDFKIEHPLEERIVGSIFKGRVQNLEDGLQAAFVDIGQKKNAFIHYWDMFPEDVSRIEAADGEPQGGRLIVSKRRQVSRNVIEKHYPVGSEIVVQVTKAAIGTKGPRVTASLSIPSRFFVLMPGSSLRGISRKIEDEKERKRLKEIFANIPVPDGCGLIVRTAGINARSIQFVRDIRSLLATWADVQQGIREKKAPCCLYQEPDLIERVIRDSVTEDFDCIVIDSPEEFERIKELSSRISKRLRARIRLYDGPVPIFQHYDAERQLEDAFRRKVMLKSGGCIVFDETEALIAVDVNTGQHKGASNQDDTILQVNLEAVEEVARHLRFRNIGGLVVLDLIDMRQRKHRNIVYQAFKDALRNDKARTNVLPISSLGLLEMTRQRMDESIEASMFVDCPYCHGRGRVKSPFSMSVEIQRRISEVMLRYKNTRVAVPLRIILNPQILNRLREEDEELLIKLESKHNGTLAFRADPAMHMEQFAILQGETEEVLYASESK